jgi:hypothetical protein
VSVFGALIDRVGLIVAWRKVVQDVGAKLD